VISTAASSWDVTFRIRVSGNRSQYFAPTQVGPCTFWVRADLGITMTNAAISQWADQSGSNDPNKNLVPGASPPTVTQVDTSYNNQQTMAFSGNANCYFESTGIWAHTTGQPNTWVIVGHSTAGMAGPAGYVTNGNTNVAGFGQAIYFTPSIPQVSASAGNALSYASPWSSPAVLLVEFDTTTSNIYHLNSLSSVALSGNIGNSIVNALSFGVNNLALGGGNTWEGTIAEAILFNALLSSNAKSQLRTYLGARYNLALT
jgi:hypothetical protein